MLFRSTLAYNAVHSPMQATDRHLEAFSHLPDIHRRIFAAMLAHLDESVGAVLAQLHSNGLEENTLVVFLSDNGGPTRELTSSNAPLRGEKGQLYEGGIRVPMAIAWKGKIPARQTFAQPVMSFDLNVTALAAAELAPAANADGASLLPLLRGESTAAPHAALHWRVGPRHALRAGDWKIIRNGDGPWELYNLAADIAEATDLATPHPERVQALAALWNEWNSQQLAPRWR